MSNYPVDFKGTNMDARGDSAASAALDAIESLGDKMEKLLRDMVSAHNFAITKKDINVAVGAIHDIVEDLFDYDRERFMEIDGWREHPRRPQPNFKPAFQSRIITNPATQTVLDEIAAQNKQAAESEI